MQKIINQKSDFDCVLACVAMFFDQSYEDIKAKFMPDYKFDRAVETAEEKSVFDHFGARHVYIPTAYGPPERCKSICGVPSLNLPGKVHAIYYDGTGYLDPQNGRPDRKFYEYHSEPVVVSMRLDLNMRIATKVVSNEIWHISCMMTKALTNEKV